jgi:hypothetical protein
MSREGIYVSISGRRCRVTEKGDNLIIFFESNGNTYDYSGVDSMYKMLSDHGWKLDEASRVQEILKLYEKGD